METKTSIIGVINTECFHILSLGLELLCLGRTLCLWDSILESRVRTANLLQDATSAEPKHGVFAIVRGIGARSGNEICQT